MLKTYSVHHIIIIYFLSVHTTDKLSGYNTAKNNITEQ